MWCFTPIYQLKCLNLVIFRFVRVSNEHTNRIGRGDVWCYISCIRELGGLGAYLVSVLLIDEVALLSWQCYILYSESIAVVVGGLWREFINRLLVNILLGCEVISRVSYIEHGYIMHSQSDTIVNEYICLIRAYKSWHLYYLEYQRSD